MPGFLLQFAGSIIVDADTGEVSESGSERPVWWVEMLRNLPHADHVAADQLLADAMSVNADQSGANARMNLAGAGMVAQQEEVLVRSVVGWNLTDEGDAPLPAGSLEEIRASLGQLPEQLVLKLKLLAFTNNQPRRGTEAATFPAESERGGDLNGGGALAERGVDAELAGEVHA